MFFGERRRVICISFFSFLCVVFLVLTRKDDVDGKRKEIVFFKVINEIFILVIVGFLGGDFFFTDGWMNNFIYRFFSNRFN